MTKKRKEISASTRWQVFARDGFCCRYCGVQAGEEGVELVIDHMVSVADGGGNEIENLLAACQRCNGGKSARSLKELPASEEVVRRLEETAKNLADQVEAIRLCISQRIKLRMQIEHMKSEAYGLYMPCMSKGEMRMTIRLVEEFGPDTVMEWMETASANDVEYWDCIKYICGIARNARLEAGE